MADATGTTVTVRLGAAATDGTDAEFAASGTTITFPGYRQVYVESRDDGDADGEREALLPPLAAGDEVAVASLEPQGHATSPPARYTEASLVKRLEELGIGRPSTWASIIQTVQDRGYVWKKGQALVPTWTAFAVVNLMEQHFDELVDYDFTARVETDLDAIAAGERQKDQWLQSFYFGDDADCPGLKKLVEENLDEIDAAAINTFPIGTDPDGEEVVVKPGKYGPYVKRGDDTASVPDDLTPDELTIDKALELLAAPKSDEPIGELDGLPVFAKSGRYGPYVQWGTADAAAAGPRQAEDVEPVQDDDPRADHDGRGRGAAAACRGRSAPTPPTASRSSPTTAATGRTCRRAATSATCSTRSELFTITLDDALRIFAEPKVFRRGGQNMAAKGPLREFGTDPVERQAGRRPRRPVRRLRHRRRDQRLDRQGRPHRGDAPRAGVRAAGDPPRAGRRQGRRAGEEEGAGEEARRRSRRRSRPPPSAADGLVRRARGCRRVREEHPGRPPGRSRSAPS